MRVALPLGIFFLTLVGGCSSPEPIVGTFTIFNRESPFLISAPHGEYDDNTGEMVWEFCKKVRWDCMIVEGFRKDESQINVNRPTEGSRMDDTRFTRQASMVYARYTKKIHQLSPRLRFYVEIHGNDLASNRKRVEIATAGISYEQARRMDQILTRSLRKHGIPGLEVRIDVIEQIRFRASHARSFGALSLIQPAIHIELPASARWKHRERMVAVMIEALPAIAARDFMRRKR